MDAEKCKGEEPPGGCLADARMPVQQDPRARNMWEQGGLDLSEEGGTHAPAEAAPGGAQAPRGPVPRRSTQSPGASPRSSLELSDDSTRSADSRSVRRGRFVLKLAEPGDTDAVSTMRYRKGRFQVTEALEAAAFDRPACRMIFSLLSMQNKQIDVLFDMIKNISGDERLFHKEFTQLSNEVYELLGMLKKRTST